MPISTSSIVEVDPSEPVNMAYILLYTSDPPQLKPPVILAENQLTEIPRPYLHIFNC
jgi:hypothetical protein